MAFREEQKQLTREAIIIAAAQEFALHGYRGTTFSGIALRMGRPKSALGYHQFPSKLDIAAAIVAEQGARWRALFEESRARPSGVVNYLSTLLTAAEDSRGNPVVVAAVRLLLESRSVPELSLPPLGLNWRGYGEEQVEASIVRGELPATSDAAMVTKQLLNAAFGAFESVNRGLQTEDATSAIVSLWTVLLAGLGVEDAATLLTEARELSVSADRRLDSA